MESHFHHLFYEPKVILVKHNNVSCSSKLQIISRNMDNWMQTIQVLLLDASRKLLWQQL